MKSFNFSVKLSQKATKDIKKLKNKTPNIIPPIVKTIDFLTKNPFFGKQLKGNKKGYFSYRIGDYRIIYEIYREEKVVFIIRIGHRKDIYR